MLTKFLSAKNTLVYNHRKKILQTPRKRGPYLEPLFWRLMSKARLECIKEGEPYVVKQEKILIND